MHPGGARARHRKAHLLGVVVRVRGMVTVRVRVRVRVGLGDG